MKIRINKYIQQYIMISRRQADILVEQGKVEIDGRKAVPGDMVIIGEQTVTIDGEKISPIEKDKQYIVMNKPVGYICSRKGDRTIFELLPSKYKYLSYIGRLDVNTSGVLLFTDDGNFANSISRSDVPRMYRIVIDSTLDSDAIDILKNGPMLDRHRIKVGQLNIKSKMIIMEIFEGKHREVRRIFQMLGYNVLRLHRIKFGTIGINSLRMGEIRRLTKVEIEQLRNYIQKK